SKGSCIWWGTMSNGDVVLAMFNRDEAPKKLSVNLSELGLTGECKVRDLWLHADQGTVTGSFEATVPRHGCKVVKLTK
ncbi:MAG: signal-peptide-containing protein, partial [Muribaculaceae bacterium]|nr:signal-peptide-containing protein [Muribaculaceae bacterium]